MSDARPWVIAWTCAMFAAGAAILGWGVFATVADAAKGFPVAVYGLIVLGLAALLALALAKDPTVHPPRPSRSGRVAATHTLRFTVGERERHEIVYTFDQMWGWLAISVDGKVIVRHFVTVSFRLRRAYEFRVGETEQHDIRIEKTRQLVASFGQPQPIRAYCDGRLVAEDDGIT